MPEIPEGARIPTDHQKSAAQSEAEGDETLTLTYGGNEYHVPADPENLDGEFLKYAADGDAYRMVSAVLDEVQFEAFRETKPRIRDFNALSEQIAHAYGFKTPGK